MSQRFCSSGKSSRAYVDPLRGGGARQRVGRNPQVVVHGQVGQEPAPLGDDGDARAADALRAHPGQVALAEQDPAAVRP